MGRWFARFGVLWGAFKRRVGWFLFPSFCLGGQSWYVGVAGAGLSGCYFGVMWWGYGRMGWICGSCMDAVIQGGVMG